MKKLKILLLVIISSIASLCYSQNDMYDNSLLFPYGETGYGWQLSNTNPSVWIGISITGPNKIGNYEYNVYITSNYYINDNEIGNVVISGIDILQFNETKYLLEQQSQQTNVMYQLESTNTKYRQEFLKDADMFEKKTLIVTGDEMLVASFFLSSNDKEIIVIWDSIKKLVMK